MAPKPYRPHLPHPAFYRIVGLGQVEVIQPPANPPDGEQILAVATVSIEEAARRFEASGRSGLSQLYQLAADIAHNRPEMVINIV